VKERPDPRPAPGDALTEWVEQGSIRPVVAKEFPLEDGAAAHRCLHDRNNVGKVVLIM
jgi:NADPH:quinone reductase-like Zn-dependent oxidoreductase